MAATLTWDASRPFGDRQGINQGCPPGYFAQIVEPGTIDAIPYRSSALLCRLLPQAPAGTPAYAAEVATINAETSPPGWAETAIAFDAAAREAASTILPTLGLGLLPLALLIVAALWITSRR